MSAYLIALVTFIYLVTAITLWIEGKFGMSVVFLGYTLANVGMIWAVK